MALKNMRKPFIHIILQIGNQRLTHCFSNFQSCKMLKATVFTPKMIMPWKNGHQKSKNGSHMYTTSTHFIPESVSAPPPKHPAPRRSSPSR